VIPVCSLLLVCFLPLQSAHEAAGAAGIRHSPRPQGREINARLGRFALRGRERVSGTGVLKIKSGIGVGGSALPLRLWERVGARGPGLSMGRNPSPGLHLTMQRSRSFASASFSKNGRRRRPMLSHKGRGDAEHLGPVFARSDLSAVAQQANAEAPKRPRLTLLLWIALAECLEL
jgi:hypothetical protein